jgi:Fe-S metabolism associated domain
MADGVTPAPSLEPSAEILAAQQEIVETFSLFDDWTERYQHIIDFGRQAEPFPEEWKIDRYRLHGCQSQVWIVTEQRGDRLHFSATSDSSPFYSRSIPTAVRPTSSPRHLTSSRISSSPSTSRRRAATACMPWCSRSVSSRWRRWSRRPRRTPETTAQRENPAWRSVAEFGPDAIECLVVILEERDQLRIEMPVRVYAVVADGQDVHRLGMIEGRLVGAC